MSKCIVCTSFRPVPIPPQAAKLSDAGAATSAANAQLEALKAQLAEAAERQEGAEVGGAHERSAAQASAVVPEEAGGGAQGRSGQGGRGRGVGCGGGRVDRASGTLALAVDLLHVRYTSAVSKRKEWPTHRALATLGRLAHHVHLPQGARAHTAHFLHRRLSDADVRQKSPGERAPVPASFYKYCTCIAPSSHLPPTPYLQVRATDAELRAKEAKAAADAAERCAAELTSRMEAAAAAAEDALGEAEQRHTLAAQQAAHAHAMALVREGRGCGGAHRLFSDTAGVCAQSLPAS
eukprot:363324-Chlamydomonas_euryale.AAC.5